MILHNGIAGAGAPRPTLTHWHKTVRDIAQALGRTESTIRGHMKNIFNKHGISRQFELAQLVLALAGLPEPPGRWRRGRTEVLGTAGSFDSSMDRAAFHAEPPRQHRLRNAPVASALR